jgi:hypothetical protein
MSHTFEELKKKTVAELREIAATVEHEAVKGYSQLNKEHLLVALSKAFNIDMHTHHKVAQGEIKATLKQKIEALKKARDEALTSGKSDVLKRVRRRIHFMKRSLRKAAVEV